MKPGFNHNGCTCADADPWATSHRETCPNREQNNPGRKETAEELLHRMWNDAEHWSGPRASSHYRSSIADAIQAVTGRRP